MNKVEGMGSLRAFVDILVEDALVVKDIKVVEGSKGLFITMPSKKGNDGEYHDTVYPITAEGREAINKAVMDKYNEE